MKATDRLSEKAQIDLRRTFCDGCGEDISSTRYSSEQRLKLTTDSKTPAEWMIPKGERGGLQSSKSMIMMYSETKADLIDRDYHFCNKACLAYWAAEQVA